MGAAFAHPRAKNSVVKRFQMSKAEFLRCFSGSVGGTCCTTSHPRQKNSQNNGLKGRTGSKEGEDRFISRQGHSVGFLGIRVGQFSFTILTKEKQSTASILQNYSHLWAKESSKKRLHFAKKKVLFHQNNASVHKSVIAMAKINEMKFELLSYVPYSANLENGSVVKNFPTMKKWCQSLMAILRSKSVLIIKSPSNLLNI